MKEYGATVERGRIEATGGGLYTVRSLTREGVVTRPIPAMNGTAYGTGALVYFFMFEDGNGAILAEFA